MRKITLHRPAIEVEVEALLEEIVDRIGLNEVINSLAHICSEKAEHIRTNWSDDELLAKRWDKRMMILDATTSQLIKNWSDSKALDWHNVQEFGQQD